MSNPDYRALCAELVAAWQKGDDIVGAVKRVRAALLQQAAPAPVAVPVADEEVAALVEFLRPAPPATEESSEPQPTSAALRIVKAFDNRYELEWDDDWQEQCLAAAIRELAEQVDWNWEPCSQLLAIAAELEA